MYFSTVLSPFPIPVETLCEELSAQFQLDHTHKQIAGGVKVTLNRGRRFSLGQILRIPVRPQSP